MEGAYVERFLNMCNHHGIELWDLKPSGHNYEMNISVSEFRKLKPIIKKTKSKVIIKERFGFPFFIHKYRKRQCFALCAMLCIFLLYVSTFFVFGIQIDGNVKCTEEVILESLKSQGICQGIRKEKVNCSKITQYLRGEFENIIWASAHINGTKLVINIRENNEEQIEVTAENQAEDIVAECDGIIVEIITRSGNPMVHIGDEVKTGDILVSGELEILNDAGEVTAYQYVSPDADIRIQTEIKYEDSLEIAYISKEYTGKKSHRLRIETGKNIYNLGRKTIRYKNYTTDSRWKSEILGVNIFTETIEEYQEVKKNYTEKEYNQLLNTHFNKFCNDLEKKGVQILQNSVKIYSESKRVFAKGIITICKDVGIKQKIAKKELEEGI